MRVIEINKYRKHERDYDFIYKILEHAVKENIEVAICLKTEDLQVLLGKDCADGKFPVSVISTNSEIVSKIDKINYLDLSNCGE